MLDIESLRVDTPGTDKKIHFNNAGASLPPQPVLNTVLSYLRDEAVIGGYELAAARHEQVLDVYKSIGNLVGADPLHISRAENATRAWDMAFYSIDFKRGDRILTTTTEYCANYVAYLHMKKIKGVTISLIDDDKDGQLDLGSLEKLMQTDLGSNKTVVSINHIPTNSGLVNPAEEVGKITKENGALYLLDACQSLGQMPVDVTKTQCDFLSATGRKFLRGPRGTGFLYVNPEIIQDLHPPVIDAWAASYDNETYSPYPDRRRFETFEFNYANFLGLGKAVDYAANLDVGVTWKRISQLADYLRNELEKIDGVKVRDLGKQKCGIVTFDYDNHDNFELRDKLIANDMNVSVTTEMNAYVDMSKRGIKSLVRASVHYYNTKEEVDRFCEFLKNI